jgi:hypothetical protein
VRQFLWATHSDLIAQRAELAWPDVSRYVDRSLRHARILRYASQPHKPSSKPFCKFADNINAHMKIALPLAAAIHPARGLREKGAASWRPRMGLSDIGTRGRSIRQRDEASTSVVALLAR